MCKYIGDLIQAKQPLFSIAIRQLEEESGRGAKDLELLGEIIEKAHKKISQLGLDPKDTKGPELYHALVEKMKSHDMHLAKKIGGDSNDNPNDLVPLIKKAVDAFPVNRSCWVLKKSVARNMLRDNPPPMIMNHLGYRSVDQMLKKENIMEIYGALRFAEGSDWLNKFNSQYGYLKPSDFETRKIEVLIMPYDRWADLCEPFVHKKKHNITHLKELGVIVMLPIKAKKLPGITTWGVSLLFHYINEIRLYSSFFKLQQVKKNFAKIFIETLIADPGDQAVMAGQNVHWRVIQRYFGKLKDEKHPEVFEPHVQPEDLHWRRAGESIHKIDPELEFWKDLDYVGLMFEDGPVTFNMMDVAASYTNATPYKDRELYHFRESLWNEVFIRYMGHKNLEEQILNQLDNDMIKPERLKPS